MIFIVWLQPWHPVPGLNPFMLVSDSLHGSDFIALTGDETQLQQFSLSLGAVYMKVPTEESYTMSHSSRLFIIDPKGQRYGIFSKSDSGAINVDSITQDLETIINQ